MGTFQLGPFVMKVEIAIILLSAIIMFFIMKALLNYDQQFQQNFLDTLFNTILIAFLIYKFSFIIFNLQSFFQYPASILYYTGGNKGIFLGIVVSTIYFIWKTNEHHWQIKIVVINITYCILIFITSSWLLRTIYLIIFS